MLHCNNRLMAQSALALVLSCRWQWLININCQLAGLVMLTTFCVRALHCDNHSLASFKDRANPPTAPTAACFVPSAESSHLVPASCCQLRPGQLLSQVSNRAHHVLYHNHIQLSTAARFSFHLSLVRKHAQAANPLGICAYR